MKIKAFLNKLSKYSLVAIFLAYEVFAFIAFSFGSSFILLGVLSLALLIILILFSINEIKVDGMSKMLFLVFPTLLFSLLTALGVFTKAHVYVGDMSTAEAVFIPISLLSIVLIGYILSINKSFNLSILLVVIYSGLALLVLLNLFSTIINFGFFHTVIYKDYYMYFGGKRSEVPLSDIAYALEGFKFIEVKINNYYLYPLLLLTSGVMLLFISPKKERKAFITYVINASIGLLAIILVPSKFGLIYLALLAVIIGLIALLTKCKIKILPFKVALYVLIGIASLFFLVVLLNNQSFAKGISNLISNNSLLNKLFNENRFAQAINPQMEDLLINGYTNGFSERFLGYYLVNHHPSISLPDWASFSSSVLADNFMTSGVIGNISFVIIIIFGYLGFARYKPVDKVEQRNKYALFAFVTMFLLHVLLIYSPEYGIFYKTFKPVYMSSPFIISLFFFTYVYMKGEKKTKEVKVHEEVVA